MDKLATDLKKKIYDFSGVADIPKLCASNISKEMNKIQAFQIKKLTKQFIRKKNNMDIFLFSDPLSIEDYILKNLQKKDLIKVIRQLFIPHTDETYSPLENSLLGFMYDSKFIGINDINNAIDSLTKKELCSLWKDIFLSNKELND